MVYSKKFITFLLFCFGFQLNIFCTELSFNKNETQNQIIIKKLFKNIPLEDLKSLEEDINIFGEKNGIKNWQQKIDLFKKTLSILTPYIRNNCKISLLNNKFSQYYSFSITNWFTILALLGLKSVTSEELLINFKEFEPYLNKLSKTPNIKDNFKYEIYKKFDSRYQKNYLKIRVASKSLIPISKITEWYNKDLGTFSAGQKFFEMPPELSKDEHAVEFFERVNEEFLKASKEDFQDFHLDFLMLTRVR